MKIAHVTIYPPRGEKHVRSSGVASYSKNLVTNIPTDEQTVVSNVLDEPTTYDDDGVIVHRSFQRDPSYLLSVHKTLRHIQPDIVHIQQELALFGGILTAYLLQWLVFLWRDHTVITLHGVIDPAAIDKKFVKENNSTLPVWLVRLAFRVIYTPLMKRARHIIVHEQLFKDIATESYGIDGNKISVVPHGVEALEADPQEAARRQLGLPRTADIALFMGYATGYKGMDLLIEGFARYAKRNPHAYLVIGAGKHPKLHDDAAYLAEYRRLQDKATALIPGGQYEWRGFIEEGDVRAYYSASDVSLYPYTTALSSSGPMALAIGYEKPFLVSSAFADIFTDYQQLVFKQTPEAMSKKLAHFFSHLDDYSEISYQLKQERMWQTVGLKTLGVYQKALNPKGIHEEETSTVTG